MRAILSNSSAPFPHNYHLLFLPDNYRSRFNSIARKEMIPEATPLVNAAERFCAWAEGEHHLLSDARQHLLALMASIPPLQHFRYTGSSGLDFPRRGREGWTLDFRRFSDLPFQVYRVVFDPHDLDAIDEPTMGDLHDDLADIYGDLWHGLQAYRGGHCEEAVSIWVDSYFLHWGRHASSALAAIDTYYCADPANASKSIHPTAGNAPV
jgi:hypothetical protein